MLHRARQLKLNTLDEFNCKIEQALQLLLIKQLVESMFVDEQLVLNYEQLKMFVELLAEREGAIVDVRIKRG